MLRSSLRHILCPTALAALLLSAAGCSSDECYENQNSLPLAGFYTTPAKATAPVAAAVSSISIWGLNVPGDSLLVDNGAGVTQVYLPFKIDTQETSFVIRFDNLAEEFPQACTDTLSFTYRIEPQFESSACGVYYKFCDVKPASTLHFLDSVTCPQGFINNVDSENIHIYIKPAQEPSEPDENS